MSEDGTTVVKAQGSAPTSQGIFYKEIKLAPSVDDPRPPEEMILLRAEYDRTARMVSVLFQDDINRRKELFLLLHQAADQGFRGSEWNLEDGKANLFETRETILDYAHDIRSK